MRTFRLQPRTSQSTALALLLTLTLPAAVGSAQSPEKTEDSDLFRHVCAAAVAAAERRHAIPAKLLTAISHAESGRWNAEVQATIAWPWTVTAEGKGHYLPSRSAAIAKVTALQARGVRNIDVGCMQVNLRYHPDAFANLDAAFDPTTNAAYAGRFLAALKRETGSWGAAAARYHSATRKFAGPYRAKVMRLWTAARNSVPHSAKTSGEPTVNTAPVEEPQVDPAMAERKAVADAHRRAVVAAYLARRAERRTAATAKADRRAADG